MIAEIFKTFSKDDRDSDNVSLTHKLYPFQNRDVTITVSKFHEYVP
jgi:hypothetical protein